MNLSFVYDKIALDFQTELFNSDEFVVLKLVDEVFAGVEEFLGSFGDHDLSFLAGAFHFISDLDILAIYIVSHEVSADDSADEIAGVDSNAHFESVVLDLVFDLLDDGDHLFCELYHVPRFLHRLVN